jgi:predicted MFS family arabinose efflux permease
MTQESTSPWALLATNGNFRRLFAAQLVSMAGDWISIVALVTLLQEMTGKGSVVSWLIVANTLPFFLVTPLAGVVADRYDRRTIMIASDVVRAVLVLGFMAVAPSGQAWLALALSSAAVVVSAFFGPAAAAAVPNVVAPHQLAAANALSSASWGSMLAVGSALGGVISSNFGREAAFMADSLTFIVSALLTASVRVPFSSAARQSSEPGTAADGGFTESLRYAWRHRGLRALLLIKTMWGVGAGVIALLSVLPVQVFKAGEAGVGLLYASRGVGAVIGPLLAQGMVRDSAPAMAKLAAFGVMFSGVFYAAFASAPSIKIAAVYVFLAHLGGGAQWVLSTTLLQRMVADRILGRVMALDMGGITLTMTVSTVLCGIGIETVGPRMVGMLAGAAIVLLGLTWIAVYAWVRPEQFEPIQKI